MRFVLTFNINYHFDFSLILKANLSIKESFADTTLIHLVNVEYLEEGGRVVDQENVQGVCKVEVSL